MQRIATFVSRIQDSLICIFLTREKDFYIITELDGSDCKITTRFETYEEASFYYNMSVSWAMNRACPHE